MKKLILGLTFLMSISSYATDCYMAVSIPSEDLSHYYYSDPHRVDCEGNEEEQVTSVVAYVKKAVEENNLPPIGWSSMMSLDWIRAATHVEAMLFIEDEWEKADLNNSEISIIY